MTANDGSTSEASAPAARRGSVSRNTLINAIGYVVPVVVSVAVVPAYLHEIGEARYGVLAIIWVVFGYFRAFDMGLGRTTTNEVARLDHAPPSERSNVVWTSIVLNVAFGILGGIVLFAATPPIVDHLLHLHGQLRSEALSAAPFIGLGVPFVTVSSVLIGALEGRERFGRVNSIEISVSMVFQLGPLAVAYLYQPDLRWLVAAAVSAQVVRTVLAFLVCVRVVPLSRKPHLDRRKVRSLAAYGGWVTITSALTPLLASADRPFIGARLGAMAVTHYVVPYNLVSRVWVVAFSVSRTLFPRLSALAPTEARALGADAVQVMSALLTPVIVIGLVLIDPFLRLWVGAGFGGEAAQSGCILLIGVWINSFALIAFTLLQGQGRPDLPAKFHLLEVAPYLLLLWVGVVTAGIRGVAAAWTLRIVVDTVLLFRAARISLGARTRRLAVQGLLVTLTFAGSLTAFDQPLVRGIVGAGLIGAAVASAWWGLPPDWRRRLVTFIRRAVMRRRVEPTPVHAALAVPTAVADRQR